MKQLDFKVYERPETTLEDYGTVLEQVGKNGSIDLITANLKNPEKRVAVVLKKEDGTSMVVSCSKTVSEQFRAGKLALNDLFHLHIFVNADNIPFIGQATGDAITLKASEAKAPKAEPKKVVSAQERINELLALVP